MTFHDVRMRGFRSRADVDEVLAWIDAHAAPLGTETIPLTQASGRVLSEAVVSSVDVPSFDRASMDGWAVSGSATFGAREDDPLELRIVGESRPGCAPLPSIASGEATRIRTGAPLPGGTDAVLPAEFGREDGTRLLVFGEVPPSRHVGKIGEDVTRGTEVFAARRRLRPQDVGLLSLLGADVVRVIRRPVVSIVVTGDEILPAGSPPQGSRIPDANGPMLTALVERDGGAAVASPIVLDSDDRLAHLIADPSADVVLVSGASSVGPEDRVPSVVASLGEIVFHGIAMRPSSPAGLGLVGGRPVFLLPGNPVSCLCAYDFFAARWIRSAGALPAPWPYATITGRLARKVVSELGRTDYVRIRVTSAGIEPLTARGASVLSSTTRADGFVVVPKHVEGWPDGAEVQVFLYGD